MREIELKASFNDVQFVVFYEVVDGHPQMNSIYLAGDDNGNDLMPLLADTVTVGLYADCEADLIDRDAAAQESYLMSRDYADRADRDGRIRDEVRL